MAVRRLLHARGYRYRLHLAPVPGLRRSADLLFTRRRVAVFIDGCFWHGCPQHYTAPQSNEDYWRAKVERNRARDAETDQGFLAAGWTVLRFWTHDTPEHIVEAVEAVLAQPAQRANAVIDCTDRRGGRDE
jgi:DNA mismatch endonuclease (patch repair protein)